MSIITPQLVFFSLVGLGQASRLFSNETTHGRPANATAFYKSPGQVLSIPLKHLERQGVRTPSLAKRYFGSEVLGVYGAAYFAELSIGTGTDQTVDVLLDTGSFELWVNPDCASTTVGELCNSFGRYDPGQSSTAKSLNKNFRIQYGQGNVSGDYYQDDVYISEAKVEGQQFGVSTQSSDVWFGILGLGRGEGNGIMDYPSVVDQLADQGYTDSKLFSLDLGGQPGPTTAVTGEIVFGGVDTNKYSGNLAKVPIDPSDPHYVVTLTSLILDTPNSNTNLKPDFHASASNNNDLPVPVIVDSGTTLSLLPEPIVSALAAGFPGAAPDGNGGYTVPCALRSASASDSRVRFGFRGDNDEDVVITVRYGNFIWQAGTDECVLGATYSPGVGLWILGDTFLRGAYVTFDQANNALYMAEYVRCGEGSNLVPVPAGADAAARIPGSCAAAPVAQQHLPGPAANGSTATRAAARPLTTKFEPAYTEPYTPVPHTGLSTGKQARPAASSSSSSSSSAATRLADGAASAAVGTFTLTDTVVRPVAYTAHNQPTTRLETVKVLTTVYRAGNSSSAPVVAQEGEIKTTEMTPAEQYGVGLETGRVAHVPPPPQQQQQGPASSSSAAAELYRAPGQPESQSQYQAIPHAMPTPPSPQSMAGAGVAFGGMGWGFNTSRSNSNDGGGNINGINSNGYNSNNMGTAGVAAPTGGGPVGPIAVPAPAPTPAPALPMRPTATHSGFIIGTPSAAERLRVLSLDAWIAAMVVSALALVAC
ncbi:aspartic peptidase domain-containing protein [Hypoxylon cercidicola]|nr:aspartic peptidase domain-containing protein [Hypoxylon cercidicola]